MVRNPEIIGGGFSGGSVPEGLLEVRGGPPWPAPSIDTCDLQSHPNILWTRPNGTLFYQQWVGEEGSAYWGYVGTFIFRRLADDTSHRFVIAGRNIVRAVMPSNWDLLNRVSITNCGLAQLGVAYCLGLEALAAHHNSLTELDLSGCTHIASIIANDNQIAHVTLPATHENIGSINLANNQLSAQEIHRLAVAVAENSASQERTFDVSGTGNANVLPETQPYLLSLIARNWIVSANGWAA